MICDLLTGCLGMIGAQAALMRRATEGGSYKVTVTLSQSVMFEQSLGLVDKKTLLDLESMGKEHQPLEPNLQTGQTAFGEFTRLGSQIEMSKTPGILGRSNHLSDRLEQTRVVTAEVNTREGRRRHRRIGGLFIANTRW